ncbi:unnamed protein product, partial [Discosporangium mesarthrocarpum]
MGRGAGGGGEGSQWIDEKNGPTLQASVKVQIPLEEVARHSTPDDAWMVFRNKVYDVSGWHEHPGGNVIFTHAGDDFTDIFAAFHPPTAYAMLDSFYIGELDDSSSKKSADQLGFERSYRELRSKLVTMGMFNASLGYYAMVCSRQFVLWAAALACVFCSDSWGVNMLGASLMALFWQQCGWLAHDFLHHQVFKNRGLGDLAGAFWGDFAQGFSVGWWKLKHNTHHAIPNMHASSADAHDGDPDIDTAPLLTWSVNMMGPARESAIGRWLLINQAFTYFPILLI